MARRYSYRKTRPGNGPSRQPDTVAKAWLRQMVISQKDAALRARTVPDGDTIQDAVARDIRDALAGSDPLARDKARLISEFAIRAYVVSCAGDVLRSGRVEGAVTYRGQVATTDVAARLSVPARDAHGARIKKPGTYPFWMAIPPSEYFAKLADIDADYDRDGLRRALMHKGVPYLRAHPTAGSLLEALKLSGVTVAHFLAMP